MDLKLLKKRGFTLESNWQELNSKKIFITLTEDILNFKIYHEKAIKKKCNKIICHISFKNKFKLKKGIDYKFQKNLKIYSKKISVLFYSNKIKIIFITGTNGKTSIAMNIHRSLNKLLIKSAYIGTLGYYVKNKKIKNLKNTTPDSITLNNLISISEKHYACDYIVIEASSIGFIEGRLGNIKADFGIITNLSQDHLDYHRTIKAYHESKIKLMLGHLKDRESLLIQNKINSNHISLLSKKFNIYNQEKFIKDSNIKITKNNMSTAIKINDYNFKYKFPYNFVTDNLITTYLFFKIAKININPKYIFNNNSINGRHEILYNFNNKIVIVDFAHTPDGLKNLLVPYKNSILKKIIIFGCGGDRDKIKRSKMAIIANKYTDIQIITDDNPRNENPKKIRDKLVQYCENSYNIQDRFLAIKKGFSLLKKGNAILFISGKGHENVQIYKNNTIKFSDTRVARDLVRNI